MLIEQSLREVGGHYLEYAREILQAAAAAGYEPILATHCEFRGADRLPSGWRVLPLFPYGSDKIHRIPSAYSFGLWRQIVASRGNLPAIAAARGRRRQRPLQSRAEQPTVVAADHAHPRFFRRL